MAANLKNCSICDLRNEAKPSTDWCSECEQTFCIDCKELHGLAKSSRLYVTVPIEDYLSVSPSLLTITCYCNDHNEKYQMFCYTHDLPFCPTCIIDHSLCNNVVPMNKVIQTVKQPNFYTETEQTLQDVGGVIVKITTELQNQKLDVDKQKNKILSEIIQTRKNINRHLDKIEQKTKNDIIVAEEKSRKRILEKLAVLEELERKTTLSLKHYDTINKYATEIQAYLGLRKISSEATTYESFLQTAITSDDWKEIALNCTADQRLMNISSKIDVFGNIQTRKVPVKFELVTGNDEQYKTKNKIQFKFFKTHGQRIRGCDVLPDGKIIFSDYHSNKDCVTICYIRSNISIEISLKPRYAFDLASIDENTIAVTSGKYACFKSQSKWINILKLDSMRIVKEIPVDSFCHGITYNKGSLFYCAEGKGIQRCVLQTENISTILHNQSPSLQYLCASDEGKVFYTNFEEKSVTCCTLTGKHKWTFKDDKVFHDPRGISVDNLGNVYVVDCVLSVVVVLTQDGLQIRQILRKDYGFDNPFVLQYNKVTKHLLVANSEKYALLFETFH